MKTIKLWRVDDPSSSARGIVALTRVTQTETERLLEESLGDRLEN